MTHQRAAALTPLVSGAASMLLLQGVGVTLLFASQMLAARALGVVEFGAYTYAMAWANALSAIAALGSPLVVTKLSAIYSAEGSTHRLAQLFGWALRTPLMTSGILIVATIIVFSVARASDYAALSAMTASAATAALVLIPLLGVSRNQGAIARGLGRLQQAYWPEYIGRPLVLLASAAVLLFVANASLLNAATMLAATALGYLVLVSLQQAAITAMVGKGPMKPGPEDAATWRAAALPLLATALFDQIMLRSDVLLIGAWMSSADVGVYHAASRLTYVLQAIAIATNAYAAREFAVLHAAGRIAEIQRLARRISTLSLVAALACTAVLIAIGGQLLDLFGAEFRAGYAALVVLCIGHLVSAALSPCQLLLNMSGRQRDTARVFGWCALMCVALNALAIPALGILGAALASAVTLACWHAWLARLAYVLVGVNCLPELRLSN